MTNVVWVGLVSVVLSWLLVGWARRYALQAAVLDQPSERSSHVVPTPRGGGAGVVGAMLLVLLGVAAMGELSNPVLVSLLGVSLVALMGWRDDVSSLGVGTRLAAHTIAAATILPLVVTAGPLPVWMGWGAVAWWMFWVVSAINVVNFMDGLDGLIGSQVILFGVHLMALAPAESTARLLGVVLFGASTGFLLWNWAPARVFLGDIGSGALGFMIVLGGALLMIESDVGLVLAFLPLYPLFLDATVTLVRRALRGEVVTHPHRSHLYQRLANRGWGHARVSLLYAAAASLGIVVALSHEVWYWPILATLYILGVLVVGVMLESRAPLSRVGYEP